MTEEEGIFCLSWVLSSLYITALVQINGFNCSPLADDSQIHTSGSAWPLNSRHSHGRKSAAAT